MTYNLKKCPRCGNKAELFCDEEKESVHRENVVECCRCALCTDGYATAEEAAQAWNAREIKGNSIDLGYEDWDGIDVTEFGKWISVKDRLPKDSEAVLVHGTSRIFQKIVVGYCCKHDDKINWYACGRGNTFICDNTEGTAESITHWMPLPEPPERS